MVYLYIFGAVVLCCLSVCFRLALRHPLQGVYYAVADCLQWVTRKKWRLCRTGQLICYCGLFGKGKTLSAVHYITGKYRQYNDRHVYDFARKKWVKQVIHVISNVDLSIPYEKFTGLMQLVQAAERFKKLDEENGTLTCILVLGDEFSVQLNSREFKKNIDPLFLNTLLTCRHHHITLVYTSQRFCHVDALLRQVTSYVVTCNKTWRFMVHGQYDAFALENASDPSLVKPLRRFGWFVRDKDYAAYDTLACVENLSKSCQKGDMLSEEQMLALQQNNGVNMEAVTRPSRKFIRARKKQAK